MREIVRPVAAALSIAWPSGLRWPPLSGGSALAQARQQQMAPPPQQAAPQQQAPNKQMPLTEKQVQGLLAAAKEMDPITAKIPENAKPDPKLTAQLEAIAKKNGFASYDEYNDVTDNIGMVMAGFDPVSKKYVGNEAVIKTQIAKVQADKKMSPKDKKEALDDLNSSLKNPAPPIQNKGNIDLVGQVLRPALRHRWAAASSNRPFSSRLSTPCNAASPNAPRASGEAAFVPSIPAVARSPPQRWSIGTALTGVPPNLLSIARRVLTASLSAHRPPRRSSAAAHHARCRFSASRCGRARSAVCRC